MDALLYHDHWVIVGNRPVPDDLAWPLYKEATAPGKYEVVDHMGAVVGPASAQEVERLAFRKVVAPIRVQHALEAIHGLQPWDELYDELLVEPDP